MAALIAAMIPANLSAANLITNGTFDADTPGFSTPADWTLVQGDVHVNQPSSDFGSALDLGTVSSSVLTTSVMLAAGESYQLTFESYDFKTEQVLGPGTFTIVDGADR